MKQNRMKEKLRAGEAAYGVSVMIPSHLPRLLASSARAYLKAARGS